MVEGSLEVTADTSWVAVDVIAFEVELNTVAVQAPP